MDNVPKETHAGLSGSGQRRKGQWSSPAPNSKAKTYGEAGNRNESSDKKSQILCRYNFFFKKPVYQNYRSESGCTCGDKCRFRHLEAEGKPSRKSKKGGAKGSVALLKESTQLGCVVYLKILIRENLFYLNLEISDQNAPSNSPEVRGTQLKNRERKGLSSGIIQKCAPHGRSPCPPKFEERSHLETLHQEGCTRKAAEDLAKHIYKLKKSDKASFYIPAEAR